MAERLAESEDMRQPLCDAVRGACQAIQQQWTAALGYLQGAYAAGCHDPICLRWLSVTLLSNGQIDAARPVLDQWRQLEPSHAELQAYLAAIGQPEAAAPLQWQPSEQDRPDDSDGRQLRVDGGATGVETGPLQRPIVSQSSSVDSESPSQT